jgi:membrane protease YdiL (CAAX protease family)
MSLHPGVRNLVLLLVATTAYSHLVRPLGPYVGSETFYYLLNKGLLAVLLLVFVAMTGQLRAAGLAGGMNLRTLPDYWPMFLLMALILGGPVSPPETGMLLALAGIAFSVGFAEELMFRGLVFHWFRDQSVRRQILISALAFGGAHLGGLLVTDAAAVIVAQSIFASGVGAIIASARARDRSIWLPIVIHAGFDFAAFAAAGSVGGALVDSPATVVRLLVAAIIVWLWAARLIWRAPRYELADVSV